MSKPWPKTWRHKETGKQVRVMPWWECLEPILSDDGQNGIGTELTDGRKFKIGSLVQVGWLLENEHGVWFGVGPKAAEAFEDSKPDSGEGKIVFEPKHPSPNAAIAIAVIAAAAIFTWILLTEESYGHERKNEQDQRIARFKSQRAKRTDRIEP